MQMMDIEVFFLKPYRFKVATKQSVIKGQR